MKLVQTIAFSCLVLLVATSCKKDDDAEASKSVADLIQEGKTIQEILNEGKTPLEIVETDDDFLDSLYGKSYKGGLIFYLNTTTGTGLVSADEDQSTSAKWGCWASGIKGADGATIGSGQQNTTDIVSGCSDAGTAARLCDDLTFNGFSDWYLPSKDEFQQMRNNLDANGYGDFITNYYWTSTEYSEYYGYTFYFYDNNMTYRSKKYTAIVRAIRAF